VTRRALLFVALLLPGVATAGPTQLLVETPPGLSPAAARLEESASSRVADVMDLVAKHGLALEEVRAVIEKDLLGEQPLPLRNARVARDAVSAPG